MSRQKHVSLDLETAATGQNAAIWSIGAVEFDFENGVSENTFYHTVDLNSAIEAGSRVDGNTLRWWMKQSDAAREALFVKPLMLESVLKSFHHWYPSKACLWGFGSNFDNRILREGFDLVGITPPWHWRDDRDLRTLVGIANSHGHDWPHVEKVGTAHNALDDAVYQAHITVELQRSLGLTGLL